MWKGKTSYETGINLWKEIGRKCNELGVDKLIVEENLDGQVTVTEMYDITSKFPNFGLLGKKIAFTDRKLSDEDGNKFGQLVASNCGINLRIFPSLKDAEKWIADDRERSLIK